MKPGEDLNLDEAGGGINSPNSESCDVLILTALLDPEERSLHEHLRQAGGQELERTQHETNDLLSHWHLPSVRHPGCKLKVLTKCLLDAGNGNAGIELLHLLYRQHRPRLVAFCGIGGSLDVKEARLGNVVVGSEFEWRGYDKIYQDGPSEKDSALAMRKKVIFNHVPSQRFINQVRAFAKEISNDQGHPARGLVSVYAGKPLRDALVAWEVDARVNHARDIEGFDHLSYADDTRPRAKCIGIMSWDYVLSSPDLRDLIKDEDKRFKAVDMESGGMAKAIKKSRDYTSNETELLVVRGISDLCSRKSDDVFRIIAADHAAAFLVSFLQLRYSTEIFNS